MEAWHCGAPPFHMCGWGILVFVGGDFFGGWGLFFFEVVVVHFDAEDGGCHDGGAEVAQEEGEVAYEQTLDHEEDAADAHQQEGTESDVVGLAGLNGLDGLRQVAQHHGDGG